MLLSKNTLGVQISNVKQVLSFHQEPFLRSWVEKNTQGRKAATLIGDLITKDFFKLCRLYVIIIKLYIFNCDRCECHIWKIY